MVVGGGHWGRRVGEVGAFSEVGGTETPPPFDEADFMAWASLHLLCLSIFESVSRGQTQ